VAVEDEKKECNHLTENDPTITLSRKNGWVSKHPTTISRRQSPRVSLGGGYGYGYGRLCAVHVRKRSTGPAEPLRRRRERQIRRGSLDEVRKLVALNRGRGSGGRNRGGIGGHYGKRRDTRSPRLGRTALPTLWGVAEGKDPPQEDPDREARGTRRHTKAAVDLGAPALDAGARRAAPLDRNARCGPSVTPT
jgi:hypothetical protein